LVFKPIVSVESERRLCKGDSGILQIQLLFTQSRVKTTERYLGEQQDLTTFSYENRSNFVVWGSSSSGRDLLINEIGPYPSVIILPRDTLILEISAEGDWVIDITGR